jgi:hypothetical protein
MEKQLVKRSATTGFEDSSVDSAEEDLRKWFGN